jgi:polysaccharide export outer membrane protein
MTRITGVVAILLLFLLPAASHGQAGAGAAVLRSGDVLRIAIWPDATLSGDFPIESTGEIYLPLVGAVRVEGRTLDDVRTEVRDRYRGVIANAVVTATPIFRVSIIGAVQRPNLYQVDPTNTVFDLVSMAGGFLPEAQLKELRLIRGDSVIVLDARSTLEEGTATLSLPLLSGDRLIVPLRPDRARALQPLWTVIQVSALLASLALQIF